MINKKQPILPAHALLRPACEKGMLIEGDNIESEMDGYTFSEKGQRCTESEEEFILEKEAERIIEAAKILGSGLICENSTGA